MPNQDWLITNNGQCENCEIIEETELSYPYRLFRFLTNLEDILQSTNDDKQRLEEIRPLVRRLLNSSEWLHYEYLEPNPDTGWAVTTLYDEPDFPLTVQTVVWLPGSVSPIHNHATWGIVAILSGEEKNTLWKKVNQDDKQIEKAGELILSPGDIISLTPDAIHNVEVMGDEPTVSFNLYGETNYDQRYEFDVINCTATNF